MNIPKRIKELLDRKQELINRNSEKLSASVVRLQSKLMDAIIDDVILEMDIVDGVIQDTAKNYRLIASLDKTFNAFSVTQAETLLPQLTSATNAISNLSNEYFLMTVTPDLLKRFDKVVEGAKEITDLRFGLKGGKFVRGGPIESLISEFGGTEVKQLMAKAVSGNMDKREFLKQMRDFVTGTDEKPGISERKWKQFAYDVYQQHDAAYNKKMADEFDMKYFVYQGGLIDDSRDFCAAHNNKVWTTEEALDWATWTPSEGEYPAGWEIKAKNPNEVPSYLGYPGYDPFFDRGGYNCRHQLGYISQELAFKLRPDLKEVSTGGMKKPEVTGFVGASTMEEAELFASRFGGKAAKGFQISVGEMNIANREISKIPTWAVDALRTSGSAGMEYIVGNGGITTHPLYSYLRNKKVPGWHGKTWNVVPGVGSTSVKVPSVVNVSSLYKGHGSSNLMLHEYAHGIDAAWGKSKGVELLSSTNEWKAVHKQLRAKNKLNKSYHAIQTKETFAESFAKYYDGSIERNQLDDFVIEFFKKMDNK